MQTLHIFLYESPIVTIKEGNAWLTNGYFKLIHVVDLQQYDILIEQTEHLIARHIADKEVRLVLDYHLNQTKDRISELTGTRSRRTRSINWIGSAWKWLAGSPDATDWDKLLQVQTDIIDNNNQQYKINRQLFEKTHELVNKFNQILDRYKNAIQKQDVERLGHDLLSKVLILKEGINEIIRACQMAKSGIVNSNILDSEEINTILNELEVLPYQNVVEAVEYGRPSVFSNGSLLLYVLSIPKVAAEMFHLVSARAAVKDGKQIELDYTRLLINHDKTYGLCGDCFNVGNTSVCEEGVVKRLAEDSCLPRILKGGTARCNLKKTNKEVIELIEGNTIFITNFNGSLLNKNSSIPLEGTYLIQLDNDTVYIKDRIYSSVSASNLQPLPPVLANITSERVRPDLDYLHHISVKNIERIRSLKERFNLSILTEISIIILIAISICLLWKKIYGKVKIPALRFPFPEKRIPPATQGFAPEVQQPSRRISCSTCSVIDLRDADI